MTPAEYVFAAAVLGILAWAIIHLIRRGYWTEPSPPQEYQDSIASFAEMETPPIRLTKYEGSQL